MSGRIALVTGAGRGIGAAIATRLSADGYRVALTARSGDQLERTAAACPNATMRVIADITEPDAAGRIADEVEAAWGPIEIAVLNAGAAASAPLSRITDSDWQHQIDVNLTAPFRCLRRVTPSMKSRQWGRVVAVASVASKAGAPYIAAYTAAKHGLLGLVRATAAELAPHGVTVNAVCPGYVDTPMTEDSATTIAAHTGRSPWQARELLAAAQPIGRLITPEEVVTTIMSCIDNSGINGQGIVVDGGGVQS